jgi:D-aspartate ligase
METAPHLDGEAMPAENVGALIVGGDYQGLGIVRSLGAHGIPICIVDDERSISAYSRFVRHSCFYSGLRDQERVVEAVLETGRRLNLKGWVLYPTRDETVAAFSHHRKELAAFFRVPTPDWSSVKWAWDKRNLHEMVSKLGLPTPKTWNPQSVEDLDQVDVDPPYAVKPAIKEHFFYKTKAKAWRANSRQELKELFLLASEKGAPGEVLIQEFIPGSSTQQFAYCAFWKNRQALGSMVVRRRRQHPHEFGRASTFVETLDLPELEAASEKFLRAIDYYGLVEVEFKLDPRDSTYKLHDVNLRTWGYHSLGRAAGVDFPAMLFADQIGKPVEVCRARPGHKWIRLVTDTPSSLLDIFKGRLNTGDYLRSLSGPVTEAVFSWGDPLPGLAEIALIPYLYYKRGF